MAYAKELPQDSLVFAAIEPCRLRRKTDRRKHNSLLEGCRIEGYYCATSLGAALKGISQKTEAMEGGGQGFHMQKKNPEVARVQPQVCLNVTTCHIRAGPFRLRKESVCLVLCLFVFVPPFFSEAALTFAVVFLLTHKAWHSFLYPL